VPLAAFEVKVTDCPAVGDRGEGLMVVTVGAGLT